VAHGPRKKPLYFGGNQDHVTLGFGLRYGYIRLGGSTAMLDMAQYMLPGIRFCDISSLCRGMCCTECCSNYYFAAVCWWTTGQFCNHSAINLCTTKWAMIDLVQPMLGLCWLGNRKGIWPVKKICSCKYCQWGIRSNLISRKIG